MSKPYTIERQTNPDVYYVTISPSAELSDFDTAYSVMLEYYETLYDFLGQENKPINVIVEIQSGKFTFDQFLAGNKAANTDYNPYTHPKCKGLTIVTSNKLIDMSLSGLVKLGLVKKVRNAPTREDALKKLF
ncbi:MAG: hypothetical protein AAF846_21830 [Chloroflexota bacterium]